MKDVLLTGLNDLLKVETDNFTPSVGATSAKTTGEILYPVADRVTQWKWDLFIFKNNQNADGVIIANTLCDQHLLSCIYK